MTYNVYIICSKTTISMHFSTQTSQELFHTLPWSHGTHGILVSATLRIIPASWCGDFVVRSMEKVDIMYNSYFILHFHTCILCFYRMKWQMDSNGLYFSGSMFRFPVRVLEFAAWCKTTKTIPKRIILVMLSKKSATDTFGRCVIIVILRPSHLCSCVWHIATEIALEIIGICFFGPSSKTWKQGQFICLDFQVSVDCTSQDFCKTDTIQCKWFRL